uniref:Uncharacterized protein n=1 Tax=Rhizophora mucronata TaxID=61149 RepID=A0A2P2J951_RHIMU
MPSRLQVLLSNVDLIALHGPHLQPTPSSSPRAPPSSSSPPPPSQHPQLPSATFPRPRVHNCFIHPRVRSRSISVAQI